MKKNFFFPAILILLIHFSVTKSEFNFPPNPVNYFEQPFDVIHYDYSVKFDNPSMKFIDGECEITFRSKNLSPEQRFYFHLLGPGVDSVFLNSSPVEIFESGDIESGTACYFLNYTPKEIEEIFYLKIYYSGLMESEGGIMNFGGVHYDDEVLYAMGVGFTEKSVSTTRMWLPCFDHPSDKATVNAQFDVPAKYSVVSNGKFISKSETDNGRIVFSYNSSDEIATYLMTFAVGEFDTIKIDYPKHLLPITIYAKPEQIEAARYAFATLPEILGLFEEYFGKYPFEKLDFVLTKEGSMEHQTLINIAGSVVSNAYSKQNMYHSTIIHELAHQWFGNLVTPLDFRDAWLNESFASFCEALIYEKIVGRQSYIKHLRDQTLIYFNYGIPREGAQPLYDFDREKATNYPITIYYKGSNVLSMLRYLVGDDQFFGAINRYIEQFAYSNVSTDMFINTFSQQVTADLKDFFNTWIFERGWIVLDLDIKSVIDKGNNTYESKVTLRQVQSTLGMPIINTPIEFSYSEVGMTPIVELVEIDDKDTDITFISDEVSFSSVSAYRVNWGEHFVVPARIARVTSVENQVTKKSYTVRDHLYGFEINTSDSQKGELCVLDLTGRELARMRLSGSSVTVDKNLLANGIYFVIIYMNNRIFIEKFYK